MYVVNKNKITSKMKLINTETLLSINGFLLPAKRSFFKVCGTNISNIKIIDEELARPIVSSLVHKKYNNLVTQLVKMLVEANDDDSGDSYRQVLDRIEKFRLLVKNKYRAYLKRQELGEMSKKLITLQNQAIEQIRQIQDSYYRTNSSTKGGKGR